MRRRSTTTTTEVGSTIHSTSVEVLDDCYLRVIADPELASCFDFVDIRAIKHHLRSVIADTVGRPEPPETRSITASACRPSRMPGSEDTLPTSWPASGFAMPPGQDPAVAGGSRPASWS